MNHPEWLLLLFVALAAGYWMGRRDGKKRHARRLARLSKQYLTGFNYLLNERPDKAVEAFINSLDVDEHTLETHLALARLFRKRGELDRATLIHNALLESGKLPDKVREDVELELAQDYVAGGLFDRAEWILQQMLDKGASRSEDAMRMLMHIFEQERDWHNALSIGERLLSKTPNVAKVMAHYCCELAEHADAQALPSVKRRTLRRALSYDHDCVRATLLLARLEQAEGHYDEAVSAFRRIRHQDRSYFDLLLDEVESVYEAMAKGEAWTRYLTGLCVEQPSTAVILKLGQRLRASHGGKVASAFIADYMKAHPTVKGLDQIIDLNIDQLDGSAREHLGILKSLTARLLSNQPTYQCADCGFEAQQLHWQCPSCKHWDSLRPFLDTESVL